MNLSPEQARSFFGPLKGRTTTFVVGSRQTNIAFARGIMALAAQSGETCIVLDIDAFYASNADDIFAGLRAPAARSTLVQIPEPGSRIEDEFPKLFSHDSGVMIVDSLNSLHHLLSSGGDGLRGRKFSFAIAVLSFVARAGNRAVMLAMYRREGITRAVASRSISSLSDSTVSAEVRGSELVLECQRGLAWQGARFSIHSP